MAASVGDFPNVKGERDRRGGGGFFILFPRNTIFTSFALPSPAGTERSEGFLVSFLSRYSTEPLSEDRKSPFFSPVLLIDITPAPPYRGEGDS